MNKNLKQLLIAAGAIALLGAGLLFFESLKGLADKGFLTKDLKFLLVLVSILALVVFLFFLTAGMAVFLYKTKVKKMKPSQAMEETINEILRGIDINL